MSLPGIKTSQLENIIFSKLVVSHTIWQIFLFLQATAQQSSLGVRFDTSVYSHKYSVENGLHQIRWCDQRNDLRERCARPIRDQRISDVSDRLESLTTESAVPLRREDVSLVSKYFADCSLIVQIVDVVWRLVYYNTIEAPLVWAVYSPPRLTLYKSLKNKRLSQSLWIFFYWYLCQWEVRTIFCVPLTACPCNWLHTSIVSCYKNRRRPTITIGKCHRVCRPIVFFVYLPINIQAEG